MYTMKNKTYVCIYLYTSLQCKIFTTTIIIQKRYFNVFMQKYICTYIYSYIIEFKCQEYIEVKTNDYCWPDVAKNEIICYKFVVCISGGKKLRIKTML